MISLSLAFWIGPLGVLLPAIALAQAPAAADSPVRSETRELEGERPLRTPDPSVERVETRGRPEGGPRNKIPKARLEELGLARIDEVSALVPNLKLDNITGNDTAPRVFIRGVGQDRLHSMFEPGVALYKNDVYLPFRTGGLFSTLDADSIEVRRGPQGTTGGWGAVGGVVHFVSRRPQPDYGAAARVSVGNLGRLQTESLLNLPLSVRPDAPWLLTRWSFRSETDDGFSKNRIDGERAGDTKLLEGRAALRWLSGDDVEFNLTWERSRRDQARSVGKCRDVKPFLPLRIVLDTFYGYGDACDASRATPVDDVVSEDISDRYISGQTLTTRLDWSAGGWNLSWIGGWQGLRHRLSPGDLDNTAADVLRVDTISDRQQALSQELRVTRTLLGGRVVIAGGLFGFRHSGEQDGGSSRLGSFVTDLSRPLALEPQEPRFGFVPVPEEESGPLSAFLSAEEIADRGLDPSTPVTKRVDLRLAGNLEGLSQALGIPLRDGRATGKALDRLFGGSFSESFSDPAFNQVFSRDFDHRRYAGFGSVRVDLTPRLSLSAGLRYTAERKERRTQVAPKFPGEPEDPEAGGPRTSEGSLRLSEWTPAAELAYTWRPVTVYASWARGFRGGGFNETETRLVETFDPETLDTYEVGFGSSVELGRVPLHLRAAYFYSVFRDMQVDTSITTADGLQRTRRLNAARATIQGFELEAHSTPWPNLDLYFGLGYVDAAYDSFKTNVQIDAVSEICPEGPGLADCPLTLIGQQRWSLSAADENGEEVLLVGPRFEPVREGPFDQAVDLLGLPPQVRENVDMSGLRFHNTPRLSFNVGVRYSAALGDTGTLIVYARWNHQDETFQNFFNTVKQGRFGVLSGGLELRFANGRTRVGVYVKNATNRRYIRNSSDRTDFDGTNEVYYSSPRTYGVYVQQQLGAP